MKKLENFATGHLDLDEIPKEATDEEKAFYLGERLGCPVVHTLIKEKGAEVMARRYGQLLLYYGYILDALKRKKPAIAEEISKKNIRAEEEQMVRYDENCIPDWNKKIIPGTEAPWGYALPRMLISYVTDDHGFAETKQEVWMKALLTLDQVVENLDDSDTADEFLVKFAEALAKTGANPKTILAKTISAGKLKQENLYIKFSKIIDSLSLHAPTLWKIYESLSSEEKKQLGIAEV
jgi:hypothetical protein